MSKTGKKSNQNEVIVKKPVINIHMEEQRMKEESDSPSKHPPLVSELIKYEEINAMHENFKQKTDSLIEKLNEKSQEIDHLCTLLDCIEPIPGLDPEKYLRIIEGKEDGATVDYRDTKIVELAKKCRRLQVALNKERANEISNQSKIAELLLMNEQLSSAAKTSSPGKRRGKDSSEEKEEGFGALQKELSITSRALEESRRKYQTLLEDFKKQQRVLLKEVGEGVMTNSSSPLPDEGWKGRAQQIVMLKSKIKRLESESHFSQSSEPNASSSSFPTSRRRMDVDSKVEAELSEMSMERGKAMESLQAERVKLSEENVRLKDKLDASRARMHNLNEESNKLKENLKVQYHS